MRACSIVSRESVALKDSFRRRRDQSFEIQRIIRSQIFELASEYNASHDNATGEGAYVPRRKGAAGLAHSIPYPNSAILPFMATSRVYGATRLKMIGDGTRCKSDVTASSIAATSKPTEQADRAKKKESAVDFSKKDMVMLFTCGKCDTRAAKAFSKKSYTQGVVIVECPGCKARHLVADHLGWFGSQGTIEDFAKESGARIDKRIADNTLELTLEDLTPKESSSTP